LRLKSDDKKHFVNRGLNTLATAVPDIAEKGLPSLTRGDINVKNN
jgi:hypothetical protein